MKAVVINRFVEVSTAVVATYPASRYLTQTSMQSYNEINVSRVPTPRPRKDEILVQVKAAGVNFVDTLYVRLSPA